MRTRFKGFLGLVLLLFLQAPSLAFAYWQRGGNRVCYSPSYMSALFSKPKSQEEGGLRSEIRSLEREIRKHQRDMDEMEAMLSGSLNPEQLKSDTPNRVAGAIRGYIEGGQDGWNCDNSSASKAKDPSKNRLLAQSLGQERALTAKSASLEEGGQAKPRKEAVFDFLSEFLLESKALRPGGQNKWLSRLQGSVIEQCLVSELERESAPFAFVSERNPPLKLIGLDDLKPIKDRFELSSLIKGVSGMDPYFVLEENEPRLDVRDQLIPYIGARLDVRDQPIPYIEAHIGIKDQLASYFMSLDQGSFITAGLEKNIYPSCLKFPVFVLQMRKACPKFQTCGLPQRVFQTHCVQNRTHFAQAFSSVQRNSIKTFKSKLKSQNLMSIKGSRDEGWKFFPSWAGQLLIPPAYGATLTYGSGIGAGGEAEPGSNSTSTTIRCGSGQANAGDYHCKPGATQCDGLDSDGVITGNCCPNDYFWRPKGEDWTCVAECGDNWRVDNKQCVCEHPNSIIDGKCVKKEDRCHPKGGTCRINNKECLWNSRDCCKKTEDRPRPVWYGGRIFSLPIICGDHSDFLEMKECKQKRDHWNGELSGEGSKLKCCPKESTRYDDGSCCPKNFVLIDNACTYPSAHCASKGGKCKPPAENCIKDGEYNDDLCCKPSSGEGAKEWVDEKCEVVEGEAVEPDAVGEEDNTCAGTCKNDGDGTSCSGADCCPRGSRWITKSQIQKCCKDGMFLDVAQDLCVDSCGSEEVVNDNVCPEQTARGDCPSSRWNSNDSTCCEDGQVPNDSAAGCQTANNCPDWKKHEAFRPNGQVSASFCDTYASDKRACKRALQKMKRLANKIARAQKNLEKKEDERWEERYGEGSDEEKTESGGLCFDCLKRALEASRPSAGQQIGNALSILAGAGISAVGYNMGRRAQYDANMQRIDRGGYAARNDLYSFAGARAGFPFIHRGIYGITKVGTPSGGWSCSPSVNPHSYY